MNLISSIEFMKKVFKAEYGELQAIHEYVKNILTEYQVDEALIFKALVFSEEITTNISQYAYSENTGTDPTIEIDIRIMDKNGIVMEFSDYGAPFDPSTYHKPEGGSEIEMGGLGLVLVKEVTHKLAFRRDNHRNIITATILNDDAT